MPLLLIVAIIKWLLYTDQGNGYQGRAVVGTVDASNNSISFGSVATFHAAEVQNDTFGIVFDRQQ